MKSIPILLFALAGAIFASCSREEPAAPRGKEDQNRNTSEATLQKPPVATSARENQNWTILSETDVRNSASVRDSTFQGIWQPSESDVLRAINEARLYLEKRKKTASSDYERKRIGDALARWDKYLCQAIGHTKEGKKLIHLNFFINVFPRETFDWRHGYIRYLRAIGDGAMFWRIEYDYKAMEFLDFHANDE